MNTLVIGGTGTVGSQVGSDLLRAGANVFCLTRSKEKAKSLPSRVEARIGNLEDPDTLSKAFKGMDSLFLLVPVSLHETQLGLDAVNAAKAQGVGRIVYMSVHLPEGSQEIPHFRGKIPIEEAVRNSGIPYTILRPNNFFQNDYWFKDAILAHNLYPQPIGSVGVSRIDVRDISEAAVRALTLEGFEGKTYTLAGLDALTGEQVAEFFSRGLGRQIRYAGDDLEAFARRAKNMMPEWMVRDMRIMFQHFQEKGLKATDADLAQTREILGHTPRRFEDFVNALAASWREELGRMAEAV